MPISESTIKVLHLSSERTWRGGEQQIAYLIDELSKAGVNILVAAKKNSIFYSHCIQNNIPVIALPFANTADLATAWSIKTICQQHGVHLIHMHSSKSHSIGVLAASLGCNVPLVLSRRVDFVPKSNWFTKWKYNHKAIERILCVSDKINSIIQSYIDDPSKSLTIHSGIDLEKFDEAPTSNRLRTEFEIPPQTLLIGNTSALEHHKDYFTFIDTIGYLVLQGLSVKGLIIGKGSLEGELQKYVTEKNLDSHVIFTGFRNDIKEILPELDFFLMTSNEEGLGTSVLDAFLARVAVIATRAGGIPEMVIHEKTGLLSPIGDAKDLAKNINRLIKDSALKVNLIEGAYQKVREFSKESTALKTLKVYKEILGAK